MALPILPIILGLAVIAVASGGEKKTGDAPVAAGTFTEGPRWRILSHRDGALFSIEIERDGTWRQVLNPVGGVMAYENLEQANYAVWNVEIGVLSVQPDGQLG